LRWSRKGGQQKASIRRKNEYAFLTTSHGKTHILVWGGATALPYERIVECRSLKPQDADASPKPITALNARGQSQQTPTPKWDRQEKKKKKKRKKKRKKRKGKRGDGNKLKI